MLHIKKPSFHRFSLTLGVAVDGLMRQESAKAMDETVGLNLDGYELIRELGSGGFGEVWLCRSVALGGLHAIKLISSNDPKKVEKELSALKKFRAAAGLDARHLVPIEHLNRSEQVLYYVMPLADGLDWDDPISPSWKPHSLAAAIERRRQEATWFSSGEIVGMIAPVLLGLQALLEAGLVHGDVKPSNILFFSGSPRLADLGLLDDDRHTRSKAGTPSFSAPSWYRDGIPDMYSAAATLHVLLTGRDPDTMGRSAFQWPPGGKSLLSASERSEWARLHRVVRRAVDETVTERFMDFAAMLESVRGSSETRPVASNPLVKRGNADGGRRPVGPVLILMAGVTVAALTFALDGLGWMPRGDASDDRPTAPSMSEEEMADYRAIVEMIAGYDKEGEAEKTLAMVDALWSSYPQSRSQPVYSIYRAKALVSLGRNDEAREELRKPVHISPKVVEMPMRVSLWESLDDLAEAERAQTKILITYGPNTMALFYRAGVRAKLGNYEGVEEDRVVAMTLNPDEAEMQEKLVTSLWQGLAEKDPGYAKHLTGSAARGVRSERPRPNPGEITGKSTNNKSEEGHK